MQIIVGGGLWLDNPQSQNIRVSSPSGFTNSVPMCKPLMLIFDGLVTVLLIAIGELRSSSILDADSSSGRLCAEMLSNMHLLFCICRHPGDNFCTALGYRRYHAVLTMHRKYCHRLLNRFSCTLLSDIAYGLQCLT